MKKYILFSYDAYDAYGGWNDLRGSYDTVEEARSVFQNEPKEWGQIVDLEIGILVETLRNTKPPLDLSGYEVVIAAEPFVYRLKP